MLFIKVKDDTSLKHLICEEGPLPQAHGDNVRIQVCAAGVNRADIFQKHGLYAPPVGASPHLGLEVSGYIDAVGEKCDPQLIGQPVCALVPGGGYGEYVLCPAAHTLPIPKGLSMEDAASLPESMLTVWDNVWEKGKFTPGKTVLVHGGNSGIGTAAIQSIQALGGTVITTIRSEAKAQYCKGLGAKHALIVTDKKFAQQVNDITEGRGVDIILDMIGGAYMPENLVCLAQGGILTLIAFQGGMHAEVNLRTILSQHHTLIGNTLRPQTDAYKTYLCQKLIENIWPLLENQKISPVVNHVFSLSHAQDAHNLMESGTLLGKIILKIDKR